MTKTENRLGGVLGKLGSLRPRLGTRTVLEISILGLVVVLAIIFRVLRVRWGAYLDGYDPLFQYRVTEYVVKNGYAAWFSWHDTLSWWPMGRDIAQSSFPAMPFTAAFFYQVLRAAGVEVTLINVCLYFPVFMGAVTCVAMYFLGKEFGGRSVGLLAAFFMAVSKAFISRTFMGFFDLENVGIFSILVISLFFIRSIDKEKGFKERVAYAVGSGLFLGYLFAAWGAARYMVGLLLLFMIASVVTRLYERNYLISYGLTMGIGFLIAVFVPKLGFSYLTSIENAMVLFVVLALVVYEGVKDKIETRRLLTFMGVLVVVLIVGLFALQTLGVIKPLGGKFWRVIDPRRSTVNALYESVGEHRRASWTSFFGNFGLTLIFGIFATYICLTEMTERRLYAALFFLTGVYFAGTMTRLGLILSIPASLMAGFGLERLVTPFIQLSRKGQVDRRSRRRGVVYPVSRELSVVFILFVLVGTLPTLWGAMEASARPVDIVTSHVPILLGDGTYPQDWLQTLSWMRENLPEDAIVVSWWDQGYWIETMANRTTLADGATMKRRQINNIANIMMSNRTTSLSILEDYGATHIVVFQTNYNPEDPRNEWPFGYNAIWGRMVEIAGLEISDFIDQDGYKQRFLDSTLAHLMAVQPGPGFTLVFNSQYSFVLLYEINYGVA